MRAWPLSLEGAHRLELSRTDFLFQIFLYCILQNEIKVKILNPATALMSAASKDDVILSFIIRFLMSLGKGPSASPQGIGLVWKINTSLTVSCFLTAHRSKYKVFYFI